MTGKPMAFLVLADKPRKLVAVDLESGQTAWSVEADVQSRVEVGGSIVAVLEGTDRIVARDVSTGAERWSVTLAPKVTFLGMAADGDNVYYSAQDDRGPRTWHITALSGGNELWREDSEGLLGAPEAAGGLVYMPYLKQWLSILDGQTGKQIARIRQKDEAISFVQAGPGGVFYGSQGVFRLDERAATGTRAGSTYATAKLPDFADPHYGFDAFDRVQTGYSAFDRRRVLWHASEDQPDTTLDFEDGQVVLLSFRFLFAFDAASGELEWAYRHPRFDVVSAEHTGPAVVYVGQTGEIGALDARTGAALPIGEVDGRVLGATIDAGGFGPAGTAEPASTADTLAAIALDKDARLEPQKLYALGALVEQDDPQASETLLAVLRDENMSATMRDAAGEALANLRHRSAAPALVNALAVRSDFITGDAPRTVPTLARALGKMGAPDAVPTLVAHLEDPATAEEALPDLVWALGQSGDPAALPPLRNQLLLYRADPAFAAQPNLVRSLAEALVTLGDAQEKELIAFVATDAATHPDVADLLSGKKGLVGGAEAP